MLAALALIAAQPEVVVSLGVLLPNGSSATMQVRPDKQAGYTLTVDCLKGCSHSIHFAAAIGDTPLGFLDLQRDGLVYSLWGTGCCYMVRVWQVTPVGVKVVLETGSRTQPSLIAKSGIAIETYMRRTDAHGREIGTSLRPMRWTYRQGRFVRF
jgi:hypothetical protein